MDQNDTREANLHSLAVQKQALHQQILEVELALKELDGAKQAYRIVSGLMINTSPEKLKEELTKKKEANQARLATIERHEQKLKEKHG